MKHTDKILTNPRITEKAAILSESGCYTFDIAKDASKKDVAAAVKAQYKVIPLHVRTINAPRTVVFRRGKKGMTGGGKKAYVYLKKGDKIEVL